MINNKQPNHKCVLCGAKYHACDSCFEIKTYTPWRTVCDTFNHYLIWGIIRSYKTGILSKEQAHSELISQGVFDGNFSDFLPEITIALDEIFDIPKPVKSKKKTNELEAEISCDDEMITKDDGFSQTQE